MYPAKEEHYPLNLNANNEDHHPDIHIYYNKVEIELSTHSIGGLSGNDFIVARKIEKILET